MSARVITGALGIMVLDVRPAEQAQAVVYAAKYAPVGARGLGLGLAQTSFGPVNARDFMDYSNRNTTNIVQIESPEGMENIEAIGSTPGLHML